MKLVKHHEPKVRALTPVARGFTPFWPLGRLESEFDRWFQNPFSGWFATDEPLIGEWMPAVNVYEEKHHVVVKAELPGMKKEEFKVYLTGDHLNIAGERKAESEEKTAGLYRAERFFGRFHRSIPLPTAVDAAKIDAHYKDGILTITCPKTEAARQREVKVKVD